MSGGDPTPRLSAEESAAYRARQRSRATALAWVLAALCVLFFLITIVKIGLT